MSVFKALVMGLSASGKTTYISHVFEGKEFDELKEYVPTVGVHISVHEYKGSEQVGISSFDCGGQTSFIDSYFTDQWVPIFFGRRLCFSFWSIPQQRRNWRKLVGFSVSTLRM